MEKTIKRAANARPKLPRNASAPEAPRKKNFRLHQSKIDRAMEILGTKTETETIEQALDMLVFRDRLVQGVRNMRGAGLQDIFEYEG
jgi:hypothetical protein